MLSPIVTETGMIRRKTADDSIIVQTGRGFGQATADPLPGL